MFFIMMRAVVSVVQDCFFVCPQTFLPLSPVCFPFHATGCQFHGLELRFHGLECIFHPMERKIYRERRKTLFHWGWGDIC